MGLHDVFFSPDIIRMMSDGVCGVHWLQQTWSLFLEKREGNRKFGRSRRRCDNKIKTDIKGIE